MQKKKQSAHKTLCFLAGKYFYYPFSFSKASLTARRCASTVRVAGVSGSMRIIRSSATVSRTRYRPLALSAVPMTHFAFSCAAAHQAKRGRHAKVAAHKVIFPMQHKNLRRIRPCLFICIRSPLTHPIRHPDGRKRCGARLFGQTNLLLWRQCSAALRHKDRLFPCPQYQFRPAA